MYNNLSFEPTRGIFYIVLAILLAFLAYAYYAYYIKNNKLVLKPQNEKLYLLLILLGGFLLRLVIASLSGGQRNDVNTNISWANTAANNLFGFYDNKEMFVDYPPGAIIIFYFVGVFAKFTGIVSQPDTYNFIIKLPGIFADVISTILIYKIAEKRLPSKLRLWVTGIYFFSPAILINAADYGQVDSLMVMFILGALYLMLTDRVNLSAILFAASILVKPQSIFLLPVLLFELLRRKNIKNFIISFLYGLGTAVVVLLPFSVGKSPFWIIDFYKKASDVYKYATINAFNLFALFGANWKPDSDTLLGFSYSTWGYILSFMLLVATVLIYFLAKNKSVMYAFYSALILNFGVFMLFARIKERYIFPAVALSLAAFIVSRDWRMFVLHVGLSITSFINTFVLYSRVLLSDFKDFWIPVHDPVLILCSVANLLMFIYLMKVTYDVFVNGKIIGMKAYEGGTPKQKGRKTAR
jgi:Gpi18-like mannosyltransferase